MRRSAAAFLVVCVRRMGLKMPNWIQRVKDLRIDLSGHVAADVVRPVGVADVGRRCRKPRLEGERIPHGNGVAAEADLVAVVAQAAPPVEK